jgi:hypothetical protein
MLQQRIGVKSVEILNANDAFFEVAVRTFLNTEEGQKNFPVTKSSLYGVTISCLWEGVTNEDLLTIVAWCQQYSL